MLSDEEKARLAVLSKDVTDAETRVRCLGMRNTDGLDYASRVELDRVYSEALLGRDVAQRRLHLFHERVVNAVKE